MRTRKIVSLWMFLLAVTYSFAQEVAPAVDTKPGAEITFEEKTFEFGDIHQGDQVEHIFTFENTGEVPLVLTNVQTTCGCTVPKWPRQPIPPGQKGEIQVKFNSAGKMGKQNKVIKIISNAKTPISQITITTNILPKKNTDTE